MAKHWHAPDRLRGSAGQKQRQRRLKLFPLCAHCQRDDIVTATEEIDHITPLGRGGEDTDDNCQGLCRRHHLIKTAGEDVQHGGAATHPDWLERSAIPITILCGPPCSGKTTHAERNALPSDVVIDLDAIRADINPAWRHWSGITDPAILHQALRVRNAMLGSLSRAKVGRAWFIVSAPTKAERDWWQGKLGGTVALLDPGIDELKRRALARGTPLAIAGAEAWYASSRQAWQPRSAKKRPTIGADGWPID